ncbi:MAG: filamentous hemagglutinin N-terminal domain-containing protein, partial [Rhizobiaceae bacterium]|nr:filamentous hemagglutinin N-terminal domain-containing protein [Rhizobiaceae bacterium]
MPICLANAATQDRRTDDRLPLKRGSIHHQYNDHYGDAEHAADRKRSLRLRLAGTTALTAAAVAGCLLLSDAALANPTGGVVTEGQAEITYGDTSVTVTQLSDRVIIEWQSFDVAAGETVDFVQPHDLAAALNVILGGPSLIAGSVTGNGQVFLSNPAGITFAETAQVNVASIIATTLSIADRTDFMAGGFVEFELGSGSPTATVVNYASIQASALAALVGPAARNAATRRRVAKVATIS